MNFIKVQANRFVDVLERTFTGDKGVEGAEKVSKFARSVFDTFSRFVYTSAALNQMSGVFKNFVDLTDFSKLLTLPYNLFSGKSIYQDDKASIWKKISRSFLYAGQFVGGMAITSSAGLIHYGKLSLKELRIGSATVALPVLSLIKDSLMLASSVTSAVDGIKTYKRMKNDHVVRKAENRVTAQKALNTAITALRNNPDLDPNSEGLRKSKDTYIAAKLYSSKSAKTDAFYQGRWEQWMKFARGNDDALPLSQKKIDVIQAQTRDRAERLDPNNRLHVHLVNDQQLTIKEAQHKAAKASLDKTFYGVLNDTFKAGIISLSIGGAFVTAFVTAATVAATVWMVVFPVVIAIIGLSLTFFAYQKHLAETGTPKIPNWTALPLRRYNVAVA